MGKKYPDHSLKRCWSCGKVIKSQHPDTKKEDKWVTFEVEGIRYYHCAKCKKNKGGK